ncbi:autotransporter domain-containing protein [Bordetella sp. N]|uniref:autotransporter outer membrane beta-barrel domain-containing protein n=1 Tax=Bordetella sp. N TaxID=1746199 RepID=UPI00070D3115|nr:autotransporter outer membrane beta-barrel domain-containing protein [Bordetella sp. N]ALM84342.1 hypothetical protein ASB57_16430 [Bordetella sp. N]
MKRLAFSRLSLAIATALPVLLHHGAANAAPSGTFDVTTGSTNTSNQTLTTGTTGTVEQGGTLQTSGVSISVTGDATITNNGTILSTGKRAIRDNTGSLTLTVTNGVGALIQATTDDAMQMNVGNSNVTLTNAGTIISGNNTTKGGQAIDWNAITTGSNVLRNLSTGIIEAFDADAVRPGVNGLVYNDGLIQSIYSTESNDGIDAQTNSGVVIINASNGSDVAAGTGSIIGSRHGITGGAADDSVSFAITVTNNLGGTIEGQDGSGINIDGITSVATINNRGTIIGNGVTGDGDGVDVDGIVHLVNTGTIISKQSLNDVSEGVTVGGGTIVNSGLIEGDNVDGGLGRGITLAGIDHIDNDDGTTTNFPAQGIYADSVIANSGTIRGQSDSAIAITGGATTHTVTITNLAGGLIEGGGATAAAIDTGVTRTSIVNYGTIKADSSGLAINFGGSNSSLQVLGGSAQIIGDIDGGTGTSTVTIAPGAGNAFTYDYALRNLASVEIGAGTTTLTGTNTYTGATTVDSGGTLVVNGSVASAVGVSSGGTLAGTGTVGSTTLASGATLAPGAMTAAGASSIGTLTVDGDLTFSSGSTYTVQADPTSTSSDLVHVTGLTTLAGSVVHVGTDGNYAPFRSYTILTSDGDLSGTFDTVQSNYAFLTPTLSYTSTDVDLTLERNDTSFASLGVTRNQRAVARSLDGLPLSSSLYQQVVTLANGDAAKAFNLLSGEAHASSVTALQSVATTAVDLPLSHLRANMDAGMQAGRPTADLGLGDASSLPTSGAYPVWVQVFGNWNTVGGSDGVAKTSATDGGVFIGADRDVGNGLRLGGAVGYTGSHLSTHDVDSKADVDSYTATLYGGKAFAAGPGQIRLSGGGAYTWHDLDTRRGVDVGTINQTLTSSYGGSTAQLFTELGYKLPVTEGASVEPFVGASWSDMRLRSFSESGGSAALDGASNRNQTTTTTLGLHASTAFQVGDMAGTLRATVGWRHAFGDVQPHTTLALQGSDTSYSVAGAAIARDAMALELGAEVAVTRSTKVSLTYAGQYGEGNRQNSGLINVSYRF